MVLSYDPEARNLPLGENATDLIQLLCPLRVCNHLLNGIICVETVAKSVNAKSCLSFTVIIPFAQYDLIWSSVPMIRVFVKVGKEEGPAHCRAFFFTAWKFFYAKNREKYDAITK